MSARDVTRLFASHPSSGPTTSGETVGVKGLGILVAAVWLLPVSTTLLAGLRATDLLLVLLIAKTSWFGRYGAVPLFAFLLCVTAITLSIFLGGISQGAPNFERLIFLYKYALVFLVPILVTKVVKAESDIKRVMRCYLHVFLILSSWVYIYLILRSVGVIQGNFRPSFPFSDDYMVSDAHLYSAYLAISLVMILTYFRQRLKINNAKAVFILFLGLGALLLTGSRTGLAIIFVSTPFLAMGFLVSLSRARLASAAVSLVLVALVLSILLETGYLGEVVDRYNDLLLRAANFDLIYDISSINRVDKLVLAISEVKHTFWILGPGILYCSLTWYDGILAVLLAHGGVALVGGFTLYFLYFLYFAVATAFGPAVTRKVGFYLTMCLVLIFTANIISEYILVTRSGFPMILLASLIYRDIQLQRGPPQ